MTLKTFFLTLAVASLLLTAPAAHAQNVSSSPAGFEQLSERLLPTVVNVATTTRLAPGDMPELPAFPPGSPFEDFFREFNERFGQGPQSRERDVSSLGSGFVIDAENGYIVTNNHVIKDADEIKIVLQDDTTLAAEMIGMDDKTDIAVLRVKTDVPLQAARWGDSDTARVGSWVIAIGNPFGLGGTVTAGIVSARQRDINAGPYDDFIQTDASINRGNSGGPMFNMKGEVIGVNTAIFSPTGGSVGIGFAVPSNIARAVVDQLVKYGETRRGWMGVRIQDVTEDIAESIGLDRAYGALVSGVVPDSPADKGGIQAGDVLLTFNGRDISASRSLPRLVADTEVGTRVPVSLWRQGKTRTVTVTLGQLEEAEKKGLSGPPRPDNAGKPGVTGTTVEPLGLTVAPITDRLRKQYAIAAGIEGIVITHVAPGGRAAARGLQPGDVIVEAGQKPAKRPGDLEKAIETARADGRDTLLIFYARRDDRRFVALRITPEKSTTESRDE